MKKVLIVFVILFLGFNSVNVKASNNDIEKTFENFIDCLNNNDECVYNYIDTSNNELYNNLHSNLHSMHIDYKINKIDKANDNYKIKANISVSGTNWSISGINVYFNLKQKDDKYIIYNTTLFDSINPTNLISFVFKILIVIAILALIYLIIVIVVVLYANSKKKKLKENKS